MRARSPTGSGLMGTDAVKPVSHREGEVLEAHQLGQELGRERERVEPVRDRAAELRLPRAVDVGVDPLAIAGRLGEPVHVVLRDGLPAAHAGLLPHMDGELINVPGRDHADVLLSLLIDRRHAMRAAEPRHEQRGPNHHRARRNDGGPIIHENLGQEPAS